MTRAEYQKIENYMLSLSTDSTHDELHIYRVLSFALKLAQNYTVDTDILITSCLLHDIGREEQNKDSKLDHAIVGSVMAKTFLLTIGWSEERASLVEKAIASHRYRNDRIPESIEAKILFDADKLDVSGAMGIARTLTYIGSKNYPLYIHGDDDLPDDGQSKLKENTFFREYHKKLKKLPELLFTKEAKAIAEERCKIITSFNEQLFKEAKESANDKKKLLEAILTY